MRFPRKTAAIVFTLVGVGATMAGNGASGASATSSDVGVTGFVAGGEHSLESSHPVVFVFKETNHGPGAGPDSVDMTIVSSSGGSVTDQLCVTSDGAGFNADSPSCEPGSLSVHQSSTMTVIVAPNPSSTVRIRVCTSNEGGLPDPNPSNDCKTLKVQSF
ncbi:MAG: hypothetical protein QOI06_3314 [Nocardioidaceae bacterium]|jgi:hypothetical protein|nr:hypothetical protein [Nocardioidaceae bacterium]